MQKVQATTPNCSEPERKMVRWIEQQRPLVRVILAVNTDLFRHLRVRDA